MSLRVLIIHCNPYNVSINLFDCECEDSEIQTASNLRGPEKNRRWYGCSARTSVARAAFL